jgi:hypothetical protein
LYYPYVLVDIWCLIVSHKSVLIGLCVYIYNMFNFIICYFMYVWKRWDANKILNYFNLNPSHIYEGRTGTLLTDSTSPHLCACSGYPTTYIIFVFSELMWEVEIWYVYIYNMFNFIICYFMYVWKRWDANKILNWIELYLNNIGIFTGGWLQVNKLIAFQLTFKTSVKRLFLKSE